MKDGFDPQGRYYVEGSSTGLGDIGVGAKYAFIREADKGVALSVYAKLPTGSLEDMTGTGETSVGGNFIASFERNGWSPHLNVGGLVASGDVFNELNYNLGLSYRAVQDRLTLVGELVGRRLFDVSQFRAERDLGFLTSPVTGEQFLVRDFEAVAGSRRFHVRCAGREVPTEGAVARHGVHRPADHGWRAAGDAADVQLWSELGKRLTPGALDHIPVVVTALENDHPLL